MKKQSMRRKIIILAIVLVVGAIAGFWWDIVDDMKYDAIRDKRDP